MARRAVCGRMRIAAMRDGEAFQGCVQALDGNLHLDDGGGAPRHDETDEGDRQREPRDTDGGGPRPRELRLG